MVSGRSPFLGSHNKPENPKHNESDTVASIIRRIKHGDFRMDGDAWKYVSHAAKLTIKGKKTRHFIENYSESRQQKITINF